MNKRWWLVLLVLATAACSSSAGPRGAAPRDRSVLTSEDIERSGAVDAFTAVQALRPQWLTKRGTTTIRQVEFIKIYLDGNLMGGPDQLRQIATSSIESIRHLDGLEATQRYGLDHGQGAVLVFTRRGN